MLSNSRQDSLDTGCYYQAVDITSLILDSAPVIVQQSGSSSSSSCHGELFYATFKSTITELLIGVSADAVKHLTSDDAVVGERQRIIGSVLTSMLDVVGRDAHLRHRYCTFTDVSYIT